MAHDLPTLVDDGLVTEEIGDWGQEKYQLLNLYVQLFSASMKSKWDLDASRNISKYEVAANTTVERFLGVSQWRAEWSEAKESGESFSSYLMDRFSRQMEARRYIRAPIEDTKLVRSTEKNLSLYRLALFSRHELGKKFWEQSKKYSDYQLGLSFS